MFSTLSRFIAEITAPSTGAPVSGFTTPAQRLSPKVDVRMYSEVHINWENSRKLFLTPSISGTTMYRPGLSITTLSVVSRKNGALLSTVTGMVFTKVGGFDGLY